jgi:hypothetical protein
MFDALSYRNCLKPVDAYIPSLSTFIYHESYVGPGLNVCLAMLRPVEVGDFFSPTK